MNAEPLSRLGRFLPVRVAFGLVVGAPLLTYAISLTFGFAYDDVWTILHNPAHRFPLGQVLQAVFLDPPAPVPDASRPLMVVSNWLEHAAFGEHAAGYHAVSLLLHLACAATVYKLLQILTRRDHLALAAAVLFGVLPVNIEAVASINYREDLFATLGVLMTLVGVLAPTRRAHAWSDATLVGLAFAAGLLGKESAVVVVVLLPLLAPRSLGFWRRRERTLTVLVAVLGAYLLWRAAMATGDDGVPRSDASLGQRFALLPSYLGWCFGRIFWPIHTVPVYEPMSPSLLTDVPILAGWVAAGVLAVRGPRGRFARVLGPSAARSMGQGVLLWAVAPLVTSPLVGPANERADRYLYLASVGAALVLVAAVDAWLTWRPSTSTRSAWLVGAVVASTLAVTTAVGARVWRENEPLFLHAVSVAPSSAKAWGALGWAHRRAESWAASDRALARSVELDPDREETWVVLGGLRLLQGRGDEARAIAERLERAGGPAPRGLRRLRYCLDAEAPRVCLGDVP